MRLSRTTRLGILTLCLVAVLYAAAMAYMYVFQRDFVFKPEGDLVGPAASGLANVSAETIAMADGTRVTVWQAPPSSVGAPTVLFLHGTSGNLSDRADPFRQILDSGFGLYAPTYRGYPGSEGVPSETALIQDALAHFDRVAEAGTPVILYGQSLGTGVAAAVAAERNAEALILEAPYTATVDIAAEGYPWLPVALLMKDPFLTRERIGNVTEPVLIIHGTQDTVVPFAHGETLYGLANEPKRLAVVEDAGHRDLWARGLWRRVLDFIAQI